MRVVLGHPVAFWNQTERCVQISTSAGLVILLAPKEAAELSADIARALETPIIAGGMSAQVAK